MSDIAFIVASAFHNGYLPQILAEHNIRYPVYGPSSGVLTEKELLSYAYEAVQDGTKVLIATGRSPESLARKLPIPVIILKYSVISFARAVTAARKMSKNVGCFSRYGRLYQTALKYKSIFHDKLIISGYEDETNAVTALDYLRANHVEVVVCGGRGGALVEKYDFPFRCVRATYEDNDVLDCVAEAENILHYTQQNSQDTNMLRMIQNHTGSGLLALNQHNDIIEANDAALELLGMTYSELLRDGLPTDVLTSLRNLSQREANRGLITLNQKYVFAASEDFEEGRKNKVTVVSLSKAESFLSDMRQMMNQLYEPVSVFPKKDVLEEISKSEKYRAALRLAEQFAKLNAPILLTGALGSGKSLFAQRIHFNSDRRDKPFITISCGAYTEDELRMRLFGSRLGNGAADCGELELANGGSVYFDGIENLPLKLQARLLHVMRTHEIVDVGTGKVVRLDIRFIASSKGAPARLISEGRLLEDLYYAVSTFQIEIPSLKDRREDIPMLLRRFLTEYAEKTEQALPEITPDALQRLTYMEFPGNLYHLSNIAQRLLAISTGGKIDLPLIEAAVGQVAADGSPTPETHGLESNEAEAIREALSSCGGSRKFAAQRLGISTSTLWRKMKKYHLE